MTDENSNLPPVQEKTVGWYCLHAKVKREHIAARNLRNLEGILDVFCPRIRFPKATARGKVWFVEALFPGYLFARFDLALLKRAVNAQTGISGVVHFGEWHPVLEETMIDPLRREFQTGEVKVVEEALRPGDQAEVAAGPMKGLQVVISRVLPGRDRVRVLLEWLGEIREAEFGRETLVAPFSDQSGRKNEA